jgi:hypothetical protein
MTKHFVIRVYKLEEAAAGGYKQCNKRSHSASKRRLQGMANQHKYFLAVVDNHLGSKLLEHFLFPPH